MGIIRLSDDTHGFSTGLQGMTSHHLIINIAYSLQFSFLIGNVFPRNLVAMLGIFWIRLATDSFAIEQQFHLVAIGKGQQVHFAAILAIPKLR